MKRVETRLNEGFGEILKCPSCGGEYLRHEKVMTFTRPEVSSAEHNPSARREGVKIRFACELCLETPVLEIIQHKGQTVLRWKS